MGACGFVADGEDRLIAVLFPQVRKEVEAEFSERLADASWFERWFLRLAISREINRRIRTEASPQALY